MFFLPMDRCTCLVCSMASEVIRVVQLLEVTNWERRLGTQGCGGAEMKLFLQLCMCSVCHRQKWNIAAWGRVGLGCDTELEFWGCGGNSRLAVGSFVTLRKAF